MLTQHAVARIVAAMLFSGLAVAASAAGQPSLEAYGKLPLHFESNLGQTDPRVRFVSRGRGYGLFLTSGEAVLTLRGGDGSGSPAVLRFRLQGANPKPEVAGREELPGKSHYLIGNDASKWRTNVPQFARVEYRDIWPGISLTYYGNHGLLEYDFVVSPGGDPARIRLRVEGAKRMRLDREGNLVLTTPGGEVVQKAPVIYQEVDGVRKPVPGRYVLRGKREVRFAVGAWDRTKPLVIDPVLVYATYLGGSFMEDANAIAVDGGGNAYVTGWTTSSNFPTANPLQAAPGGGVEDVFVAKLNPAGSALVYSTYLGGNGYERAYGIGVDGSGNAFVTGYTESSNFPTANAVQATIRGGWDAFVAKLNPVGSALEYSTYLGGTNFDYGYAIALDGSGNAYVAGGTFSSDFPLATPLQATHGGGGYDGFVAKLNPAGSALVYSTFLGGSRDDWALGIAVDAAGKAYVTGRTSSSNFPTASPLQAALRGGTDVFVAKLNPAGSALVYSTYLGGSDDVYLSLGDHGYAIAVDGSGSAYVTGETGSSDFPTANALQARHSASSKDVFVAKLNPAGSALLYSTYLGGGYAGDIAVDASGNALVTVKAPSFDYPTVNPLDSTPANFVVTKLNPAGSALVYSTPLGKGGGDHPSVAVDVSGNAYVTGHSCEPGFPTVSPLQPALGGECDAFVAKLGDATGPALSIDDVTLTEGNSSTTPAVLTVSLSSPSNQTVTVDYVTSPRTAFPGSDYFDVSGTLTFAPGTTSQTVSVSVIGDAVVEPDEVFLLRLRNARGAPMAKVAGTCTILNDDVPGLSIGDRTVSEGSSANAAFLVTLAPTSAQTVSVSHSTSNGTASAGSDYTAVSGTLTFTPGRPQQTIIVPILTDTVAEGSETFFVDLSNPVGAVIASGRGTGTINDPAAAAVVPMYRAYNRSSDYHLFTTSLASKDLAVTSLGYQDESSPAPFYVWNTQQPGTVPLFRLFNPNRGRHFYTAGVGDRDYLISIGMNYEGDEGFIYPRGTTPPAGATELFLLYNNNSGTHLFIAVAEQKDFILVTFPGVWVQHTSVGFVFTNP